MKTLMKIDSKKNIVLLSFLSNLIEGIAFAQLLQIPYLDLFSPLFIGSNKLSEVALFLLVYRLGRLLISITDSKLPSYFHKNGFIVAMVTIGFGLVLISFSLANTINLIVLSALMFGMGTTLSGLNLREILTTDTDLTKKRIFNIFSNVGWSIGVGLSGFILSKLFFKFEIIIGTMLIISILTVSFIDIASAEKEIDKKNEHFSNLDKINKSNFINKDLVFLFAASALMTGLITNQLNSSIMNQVTGTFKIKDGYQSLILLLPIFGSLLSFVPAINSIFKKTFSFLGIWILNLMYYIILLALFLSTNIYVYCIFLALIGLFSNEVLTAIYQAVATKQESRLRRATHSIIESATVAGAMIIWIINKADGISITFNFMLILAVPSLLLLFVSNFRILSKGNNSYDQAN